MKNFIKLVLLILFSFLLSCRTFEGRMPYAKDGIIDLSQRNFETSGKITLDGKWEFFWNHLYTPEDFEFDTALIKPDYISVPGIWNQLKIHSGKVPGKGFATYRLNVELDTTYHLLGIKVSDVSSAYK